IRDQSKYIHAALHEINLHLVLGSILASLVVLAFMRSWRSTFIAAVAIPTSVVSAFGMMWMLNFTLNSVTMLAHVLMVGIVLDGADLPVGKAGVHPERRRRVGVRDARIRSGGAQPGRHGRGHAGARPRSAGDEGRGPDAGLRGRRVPQPRQPGLHVRAHRAPHGAHGEPASHLGGHPAR